MMSATLVIGASQKPDRYSCKAVQLLRSYGHEVIAYGNRAGNIGDVEIFTDWNPDWSPVTITLYINPKIQEQFMDRIIALHPRRVIFNPGTENPEFQKLLRQNSIEVEEACTLVLLSTGQY
jgi:predicted CoA-binding protein